MADSTTSNDSGTGTPAPLGTEPVPQPTSTAVAEPSYIDIDDDKLIRVKGQEKPVKFGDHVRGFQAQATRASQEAAQLRRQLQQVQVAQKQVEQERQQREYQARQAAQGQEPDVLESLKALPYLSGEAAAEVVGSIADQIKQRDMVLLAALQQMKTMQGQLRELYGNHTNSAFDGKIQKWITDGGYPPEAAELAKEVYLAYEGDDLDQEFPQIFKARWEQLNRILNNQREAAVRKAKQVPWVPGKGGATGPTKPTEMPANASARQVADALWGTWSGSDT